mgnify:CR=1 FL=1
MKPKEPGVAVYFTWDGERNCIPVDKYSLVEHNLQAIYHCIEAKRTELRHGGINLVKAQLRSLALPNPAKEHWRDVLGYYGENLDACKRLFRAAMHKAHPDAGGNNDLAARLNAAMAQAEEELGSVNPME